jgi:hypothetical protein
MFRERGRLRRYGYAVVILQGCPITEDFER